MTGYNAQPSRHPMASRAAVALVLPAALAVAACASAEERPMTGGHEVRTVSVQGSDGVSMDLAIRRDVYVARTQLAMPRSEVWPAVLAVWADLGLPAPDLDPRSFALGITNHVLPRRLDGERLSRYLECGSSISGANADTHRVRSTIRTILEAVDGGETRVNTRIEATAHVVSGTSGPPQPCHSTGLLEDRVVTAVQAKTGAIRR